MSQAPEKPSVPASGGGIDWRAVWPLPALAIAVLALVGGIVVGVMRAPKADPAAPLAAAAALIENNDFEGAIEKLNTMAPVLGAGKLSDAQRREYHLIRARAFANGQKKLRIDRIENHKEVAGNYRLAEKHGALEPADLSAYAEALLSTGETQRAVDLARRFGDDQAARRAALVRTIVEHNLRQRDVQYDLTLSLLGEYLLTPGLDVDERSWAAARQADLRLAMGYTDEAINALLRSMARLEGMSPSRRGELLTRLGKAYFLEGQMGPAARQLEAAVEALPLGDAARGEALALGARILQANGKLEEARERFSAVRTDFSESPILPSVLLGLAECQAALGDDAEAMKTYEQLLAVLAERPGDGEVTRAAAGESLMGRHSDRFARGEYAAALKYAILAGRASAGGETPPAVLLAVGASNRRLAEETLKAAQNTEQGVVTIDQVSPVTAAEAKKHLLDAGGAFREHARAVVVADTVAYGESLWLAADSFDQGGDRDSAKEAFQTYIEGATDDDPRRPEAKFRLAQVLQAQRQWSGALAIYRELVEGKGRAQENAPSGIWADRALVPLARCLLSDDTPENDAEAEGMLTAVIEGSTLAPDSLEYRDAVTELGELHYRTGRYAEAIARLGEVAHRHPDGPRAVSVLYKLADSNRLSADRISRDLTEPRPPSERQELETARTQRLRAAVGLFETVQQRLLAKDRRKQTDLDRLLLRNSTLAIADCAFSLGDFAGAIKLYDAAAQRYSGDPVSLVAMVQIVNAYAAMDKWAEAMTAQERAQRQLAALPEAAWNGAESPMERKHWERWLESSSLIDQRRRARAGVD